MKNKLLLLSGNDIPFPEAQLSIHQPTIKEIAYIGEEAFFNGCHLLNFSKDMLNVQDKVNLESYSNFEIFMSIMSENSIDLKIAKNNVMMVLVLLFPQFNIQFTKNALVFSKEEQQFFITENNFEIFKSIIVDIFCLKNSSDLSNFEVKGDRSKQIAEKLKARQRKLAELKGSEGQEISIFSRYISILSVGENKDMNSLLNYTVYQLFDEFERYELKVAFDYNIQARMAGAQNIDDAEDWMKEIHS